MMFMFTQFLKRMPRCVFEGCIKQRTERCYLVKRKFSVPTCSTKASSEKEYLHNRYINFESPSSIFKHLDRRIISWIGSKPHIYHYYNAYERWIST